MAATQEGNYRYSGSIDLSEIKLTNFDGSNSLSIFGMVTKVEIQEDLTSSHIFGSLLLQDSYALQYNFPMIGEETLELTWSDAQNDESRTIRQSFRVYKIGNLAPTDNGGRTVCKLHFTTEEALASENLTLSRSYKGKSLSLVVKDLFSYVNSKKKIAVDETNGNQHLVVRNKSPIEAIKWLTTFGVSSKNYGNTFFFYETLRNGYRFADLENLIQEGISSKDIPQFKRTPGNSENQTEDHRLSMTDLVVVNSNDHLGGILSGLFGSRVYHLDPLTKTYSYVDFDYKKEYTKFKHLGSDSFEAGALQSDKKDYGATSLTRWVMTSSQREKSKYYAKAGDVQKTPRRPEEIVGKRYSQVAAFYNLTVQFETYGNPDVEVGKVVDLEIPMNPSSGEEADKAAVQNPYLSGKYLVISVRHVIEGGKYTMTVQAARDSYDHPKTDHPVITETNPIV